MKHPILLGPDGGRDFWVWGDRYSFKVTSKEADGAHAFFEMQVNPGSGTLPHIHHAEDELFYIVEGELFLSAGDRETIATPGSFVAVPKGTVHRWENKSARPARALVWVVPGGFDEFLMAIGTEISDATPAAPPLTPEAMEQALALAGDYHMEVVRA